jgi:hypothetical protein
MLNRSLFEDVAIAHWVIANPAEAEDRMERNIPLELDKWRRALEKHERPVGPHLPSLTDEDRKKLAGEFRRATWTGLDLYRLVKSIQNQWPEEVDRQILWQVHDFVQLFNTQVLHQTPVALRLVTFQRGDTVVVDAGPSDVHIHGALLGAFWSYANLCPLVLVTDARDAVGEVYARHIDAFFTVEPKSASSPNPESSTE